MRYLLAALLFTAAPAASLTFAARAGWKTVTTSSSMRVAQFTLVDVGGTYVAEMTPGSAPRHHSPNFRLRAAVIETPNGPYFVKLTGPAKTIAAHENAFEQFLSSIGYSK